MSEKLSETQTIGLDEIIKMVGWDLVLMERWRCDLANCGSSMLAFHSLETQVDRTKSLGERREKMSINTSAGRSRMLTLLAEVGFAVFE